MTAAKDKNQIDMLNGSLWNKLPRYALPVAATAILEQLFNASDIAVVGNFTGTARTTAVAAVGANSSIIGLILNLFIGVALGANVVIATAIGRQEQAAVHKAVHTSILIALLAGVAVTILGEAVAGSLLHMLQVPEDVYPLALVYLRIYLLGLPVIFLYNFEAAILRSIGDTRSSLTALTFSGILNVILNLFFVIVLHMTVNGVAIATVISNAISSLILLHRLLHTDTPVRIVPHALRIDGPILLRILRIGLPAGIQNAVFSFANVIIQSAINSLGTVVMAASSAAFNLEIFAYYVLNSFSQACTTFVGQNYGAGQLKRCRRTFSLSLLEDAIATVASIVIILLGGKTLLSIFNSNPEVIDLGYLRLTVIFSGYVVAMLEEIASGYLRGFGISFVPALLTTFGICSVRIAWVYLVFPLNPTFRQLMLVYPVSLAVNALLIYGALLWYRPVKRHSKV